MSNNFTGNHDDGNCGGAMFTPWGIGGSPRDYQRNEEIGMGHSPGPWRHGIKWENGEIGEIPLDYRTLEFKWIEIFDADGGALLSFEDGCVFSLPEDLALILSAPDMEQEIDQLKAEKSELLEALEELTSVINESEGVAGYHMNGAVAQWDEFDCVQKIMSVIKKARGSE